MQWFEMANFDEDEYHDRHLQYAALLFSFPFSVECLKCQLIFACTYIECLRFSEAPCRRWLITNAYHAQKRFGMKVRRCFARVLLIWKDINKNLKTFWSCISLRLRNGKNIKFLEVVCIGSKTLAYLLKELYKCTVEKNVYLASCWDWRR